MLDQIILFVSYILFYIVRKPQYIELTNSLAEYLKSTLLSFTYYNDILCYLTNNVYGFTLNASINILITQL
jgi:hypothetical protein